MTHDIRTPVTLLTGFLGSGKTTLLARLLREPGMQNTAVVINEIGEAGLDHLLVRTVEDTYIADNTVLLGSGCLCCTLRTELADTLRDLHFKRLLGAIPAFERLVIETTGLADPGPILGHLLNELVIADAYRLDAVVVSVDSVHGRLQLERHVEARRQAAVADVLLLTKSDLADQAETDALAAALTALNPGAAQYRIAQGEIAPELLLDAGLYDRKEKVQPQRWLRVVKAAAHDGIASFVVELPQRPDWSRLEEKLRWLCATHGEGLLRLKGIVHAADHSTPLAVHAVHHTLYPPTPLARWQADDSITRLVLIGEGLDPTAISAAFLAD
jgi:G3E family GTPase